MNQCVVILTFLAYVLLLTFIRRSVLNLISFLIILSLLCAYLNKGMIKLLKYWKLVSFYTAFVLLSQLAFQFFAITAIGQKFYNSLTLRQ